MDDFGTGYSSLSRLAHLPIRELKIDRSFMRDIESEASALAIARAIMRVGQSLDMIVVAEGVETEGQRRILTELGCDVIQGFVYSPAHCRHRISSSGWRITKRHASAVTLSGDAAPACGSAADAGRRPVGQTDPVTAIACRASRALCCRARLV
jgi:EAL domain-containing protein (putative c-di-GMP-specific phosphodiesterase class I)